MTSTRGERRREALVVLAVGAAIGMTAGIVTSRLYPSPPADPMRAPFMAFANVTYWILWSALAVVVLRLARGVRLTGGHPLRAFGIHLVGSALFTAAHIVTWTLAASAGRVLLYDVPWSFRLWVANWRFVTRWQVEWEVTMYWAVVALAHALAYREDGRARQLAAARLSGELAEARLRVLQQQMHPHFLFNTLQSISVLMHHSVAQADRMIDRLGELLRASIETTGPGLVTVARELEYVGHYLAIETLNIGDRLAVQQEVDPDALTCVVPELLVQPLVENAVRHGIAPLARGGTVSLFVRRHGPTLEILVEDDGAGLQGTQGGVGIALTNTRRRLEILYGGAFTFTLGPGSGGRGVAVRVTLPAVTSTGVRP